MEPKNQFPVCGWRDGSRGECPRASDSRTFLQCDRQLSGKKDDHFVKIMIMVGKFPFGLVLDVKKPEILLQIAGFSVGSLKEFICYGPCFNYSVYGTANFACSYVCVAS